MYIHLSRQTNPSVHRPRWTSEPISICGRSRIDKFSIRPRVENFTCRNCRHRVGSWLLIYVSYIAKFLTRFHINKPVIPLVKDDSSFHRSSNPGNLNTGASLRYKERKACHSISMQRVKKILFLHNVRMQNVHDQDEWYKNNIILKSYDQRCFVYTITTFSAWSIFT